MALVVGGNSYVNEAEATAYFDERYGYSKWAAEADKEAAIVSAAQPLDLQCSWFGDKVDDAQDMEFPRTPDADPVPQEIKDAQCEIAYAIVDEGSTGTVSDDPVSELTAGPVTLKFKASATLGGNPLINSLTSKLLVQFGICSSGSGSTKIIPIGLQ